MILLRTWVSTFVVTCRILPSPWVSTFVGTCSKIGSDRGCARSTLDVRRHFLNRLVDCRFGLLTITVITETPRIPALSFR